MKSKIHNSLVLLLLLFLIAPVQAQNGTPTDVAIVGYESSCAYTDVDNATSDHYYLNTITFKNEGPGILSNLRMEISIDGETFSPFKSFTGGIQIGDEVDVSFRNNVQGVTYAVELQITEANFEDELNAVNSIYSTTFDASNCAVPMTGSYSIGAGQDYTTVAEVMDDIGLRGTVGDVEFVLEPGEYNDPFLLTDGISTPPITSNFSLVGPAASSPLVTIKVTEFAAVACNSSSINSEYLMLNIENIALESDWRSLSVLEVDVTATNCTFKTGYGDNEFQNGVNIDYGSFTASNCIFQGANVGITTWEFSDLSLDNCEVVEFGNIGVRVTEHEEVSITNSTIETSIEAESGFYSYDQHGIITIGNTRISGNLENAYVNYGQHEANSVYNCFFENCMFSSRSYSLVMDKANAVLVNNSNFLSRESAYVATLDNGGEYTFNNCILTGGGEGPHQTDNNITLGPGPVPEEGNDPWPTVNTSFCNFYPNSPGLPANLENEPRYVNPQFTSADDLHINNPILFDAGDPAQEGAPDFDGDIRDSSPSIGADQVNVVSGDCVSADELDLPWVEELLCESVFDAVAFVFCYVDENLEQTTYIVVETYTEYLFDLEGNELCFNCDGCDPACGDDYGDTLDEFTSTEQGAPDFICESKPDCTEVSLSNLTNGTHSSGDDLLKVTITNEGPGALNSFEIFWSIDGVDQDTYTHSNSNIPAGSSFEIIFADYDFETVGTYDLEVFVSNINTEDSCPVIASEIVESSLVVVSEDCISADDLDLPWLNEELCSLNFNDEAFVICAIDEFFNEANYIIFTGDEDNYAAVYDLDGNVLCIECDACEDCDNSFAASLLDPENWAQESPDFICENQAGCTEVSLSDITAGTVSVGASTFSMTLINDGPGILNSGEVFWSLNGEEQTPTYSFTDLNIPVGGSYDINFGSYNLETLGVYILEAFVSDINAGASCAGTESETAEGSLTVTTGECLSADELDLPWLEEFLCAYEFDAEAYVVCHIDEFFNQTTYIIVDWVTETLFDLAGNELCFNCDNCDMGCDDHYFELLGDFVTTEQGDPDFICGSQAVCTEVSLSDITAGTVSIGASTFSMTLINDGPEILNSGEVFWSLNGEEQTPTYSFTDLNIPVGGSYDINFGSYNFETPGAYTLEANISSINSCVGTSETVEGSLSVVTGECVSVDELDLTWLDEELCTSDTFAEAFVICTIDESFNQANVVIINSWTEFLYDSEGNLLCYNCDGCDNECEDSLYDDLLQLDWPEETPDFTCGSQAGCTEVSLSNITDGVISVGANTFSMTLTNEGPGILNSGEIQWSLDEDGQTFAYDFTNLNIPVGGLYDINFGSYNFETPGAYTLEANISSVNSCVGTSETVEGSLAVVSGDCASADDLDLSWLNEKLCSLTNAEAFIICATDESFNQENYVIITADPGNFIGAYNLDGQIVCAMCDACDICDDPFYQSLLVVANWPVENPDFICENPAGCTDASILALLNEEEIMVGVETYTIRLLNNGPEVLNSITVNWSVDDDEQTPYELVDFVLPVGEFYDLNIGSINFETPGNYDLAIELESPNGVADCNTGNDSYFTTIEVSQPEDPCADYLVQYGVSCDGTDDFFIVMVIAEGNGDEGWLVTNNVTGAQTTEMTSPFMSDSYDNQSGFSLTIQPVGNSDCSFTFEESMIDCLSTDIELTVFDAESTIRGNAVRWTTATEFESAEFVLEHSIDGQNFQELTRMEAAGFSNKEIDYEYLHEDVESLVNYYRLREINVRAESDIVSSVIALDNSQALSLDEVTIGISVFPNPAHSEIAIELDSNEEMGIQVFNQMGQLVYHSTMVANSRINIGDWPVGVFIIHVTNGKATASTRLIKTN